MGVKHMSSNSSTNFIDTSRRSDTKILGDDPKTGAKINDQDIGYNITFGDGNKIPKKSFVNAVGHIIDIRKNADDTEDLKLMLADVEEQLRVAVLAVTEAEKELKAADYNLCETRRARNHSKDSEILEENKKKHTEACHNRTVALNNWIAKKHDLKATEREYRIIKSIIDIPSFRTELLNVSIEELQLIHDRAKGQSEKYVRFSSLNSNRYYRNLLEKYYKEPLCAKLDYCTVYGLDSNYEKNDKK